MQPRKEIKTMERIKIKDLKKGEFFKREIKGKPAEKVFIRGDYDRATKTYSATAYEDINEEIFIKADKFVYIGFTF